eukprot:364500-Chlamydomonas_euryale.AAC.4
MSMATSRTCCSCRQGSETSHVPRSCAWHRFQALQRRQWVTAFHDKNKQQYSGTNFPTQALLQLLPIRLQGSVRSRNGILSSRGCLTKLVGRNSSGRRPRVHSVHSLHVIG